MITLSKVEEHYEISQKEIYPFMKISEEMLPGLRLENMRISFSGFIELICSKGEVLPFLLFGDAGTGKSTLLLHIWKLLLGEKSLLPLYVKLKDYNCTELEKRKDFLWYLLSRDYDLSQKELEDMKSLLHIRELPSIVILIDGFNEITCDSDRDDFLLSIKNMPFKSVRIIISSRYDMRKSINSPDFQLLTLLPLKDNQIEDFLTKRGKEINRSELIPLLKNPMMLNIYCQMERKFLLKKNIDYYDFIPSPEYEAEILHNFIASNLAGEDSRAVLNEDKILNLIHLRFLLPATGYKMEKYNLSSLTCEEIKDIIKEEFYRYTSESFLNTHPLILNFMSEIKNLFNPDNEENLINIFKKQTESYCFIKNCGKNTYGFTQEYLRDYFSACYIKDRTEERLKAGDSSFPELGERILRPQVTNFLGELTGEFKRKPVVIKGIYMEGEVKETLLDMVLDFLRNKEMENGDYRLFNILEIMKVKRVDLSNTDLSYLDLREVHLNNVLLGHGKIENIDRGADLKGSRLKGYNFLEKNPSYHIIKIRRNIHEITTASYLPVSIDFEPENVRYSPNGRKILSLCRSGIYEFDTKTGKCLNFYEGDYFCANYSPDGKRLLILKKVRYSTSEDSLVEFDAENMDCLRIYTDSDFYGCTYINYCPYEDRFITIGESMFIIEHYEDSFVITDDSISIRENYRSTGKYIRAYNGHPYNPSSETISSFSYSPSGRKFMATNEFGLFQEWCFTTGMCIRTLSLPYINPESVIYSPDAKKILFSTRWGDDVIEELNLETKESKTYKGHTKKIISLNYSHDGKKIISGSKDKTIREWDINTGECIKIYEGYSGEMKTISYSEDDKKILSSGIDRKPGEWDITTGKCCKTYEIHTVRDTSICYSSDGGKFAFGGRDKTIKEFDIISETCIRIYRGHSEEILSVAYSPDGKKLLSGSIDCTLREWNVMTGECLRIYYGHSDRVNTVSYSPCGEKLLSASSDCTIREWDVETGECIRQGEHLTGVISAGYNYGGDKILSIDSSAIKSWIVKTGECTHTYSCKGIKSPGYYHDGERVISVCNEIIKEWDVFLKETYVKTYGGYYNSVTALNVSYDWKTVISGDMRGKVSEWDTSSGKCLRSYEGHNDVIFALCYSLDGKSFISASYDNTIKVWSSTKGCIMTIPDIPGLLLQGADISIPHSNSFITKEELKILRQYGALLNSPPERSKKDIEIIENLPENNSDRFCRKDIEITEYLKYKK